ncbi:MAG TPA: bacterial transcriptional activator domain-containing protein, partial [Thermoanaerobaculia bacterium]|nr:bacterial transcriptional activator domain-containing protein [Thermoanaerobaculia bacterium]
DIRDRLRELYVKCLAMLARMHATPEAWERLVDADPTNEEAARNLMKTLDAAGAMRVYRRLVETLKRVLEVEPEPETVALFERLKGKR